MKYTKDGFLFKENSIILAETPILFCPKSKINTEFGHIHTYCSQCGKKLIKGTRYRIIEPD